MKEIGAIFVVSISEIRTVQLAAIKRRYNEIILRKKFFTTTHSKLHGFEVMARDQNSNLYFFWIPGVQEIYFSFPFQIYQ